MNSKDDDPRQIHIKSPLVREDSFEDEVKPGQFDAHLSFLLGRNHNRQVNGIYEGENEVDRSHQNLVSRNIIMLVDQPRTNKYEHAKNDSPAQVVWRHRHYAPHLKV